MEPCYHCDRELPDNSKIDDTNWICQDCARDIAIISGWPIKETEDQMRARFERQAYYHKKMGYNYP